MKTGPGSGFEMTKLVPKDKPENYSPHTSVSDYLPPRDAGVRTPINGNVEHIDYSKFDVPRAVRESIPAMLCTCRQDTHAICRLHPLRITEEIDYSKFPLPEATDDDWHAALARQADRATTLPTNPAARKNIPLATGLLDYFPAALAEVAYVSYVGNEKHNPGEPLHHARGKSMDHPDCIMRHLTERGTIDTVRLPDGREFKVRHSAYVAWRALALLQEELEADGAPQARGAR